MICQIGHKLIEYFMERFSFLKLFFICMLSFLLWNCTGKESEKTFRPSVVTSSEIIARATEEIGGEFVVANKISGSDSAGGSFAPSPKNMADVASSDIVFFDSSHSRERLAEIMRQTDMVKWRLYPIFVSAGPEEGGVIISETDYNPYYWLDAELWGKAVSFITDNLVRVSPENERIYRRNEEQLLMRIREADKYIFEQTAKIPENKRIIVTSSDSFDYFAKRYGFKNAFLTENPEGGKPSVSDFARLENYIKENGIKTVFIEYSVSPRNMEILKNNLALQGYNITIGGALYSKAFGGKTYAEVMTDNIDVILKAIMEEKL